ncbi:DUF541 domain-containing protein [Pelomyxa schiedti]|nr:DUF541 domain-containing protein [Pelomyxa schiedti]
MSSSLLVFLATVSLVVSLARCQLTVIGTGISNSTVDVAVFEIGVFTNGTSVFDVVDTNSKTSQAVIQAVLNAGIPNSDLKTTFINLYPMTNSEGVISEWQMTNMLTVTSPIPLLPQVLQAALLAGANRIQGVQFQSRDYSPALIAARALAVADAQVKAANLATLSKKTLGNLLAVSEPPTTTTKVQYDYSSAYSITTPPIAPGSLSVEVNVQMVFALV